MRKPKILFIDMDGTLIDSEVIWQQIQLGLANQLDPDQHESFLESVHGYSIDAISREIYKVSDGFSSVNKLREELCIRVVNALPNAKAFLDSDYFVTETARVNMLNYIVSNSSKEMMHAALGPRQWMQYVTGIFSAEDDVVNKKPAPDIYEYALNMTNTLNKDCLAIEDSLSGFKAATEAGIPTVFLNRSSIKLNYEVEKKAAFIATDFKELIARLETEGWLRMQTR